MTDGLEVLAKAKALLAAERAGTIVDDPSDVVADEDVEAAPVGPPVLDASSMYGPLGDWVRLIAPHTEASPAALIVTALAGIGTLVGRSAHMMLDGSRHGVNLFAMLIGPTGSGRKGTAVARVKRMLAAIDDEFAARNFASGLSSGQGIIHRLRDARQGAEPEHVDDGITDKRLLIIEPEFASVLRQMRREGNTLSAVVREAYDGETLRTLTKGDPMSATDPHIGIIAQITPEELRKQLDEVDLFNGFLNRFLPIWTEREQFLPFGSEPDCREAAMATERISAAVSHAQGIGAVDELTPAARDWWIAHYAALTTGLPGRVGAATQRGAAHVRRVALLFALMDERVVVDLQHLEAAHAIWRYAAATAAYIFGAIKMSARAVKLNAALLAAGPRGLDRATIRRSVFASNNVSSSAIAATLGELRSAGLARTRKDYGTGGRAREVWIHIEHTTCSFPANFGNNGKNVDDHAESPNSESVSSHSSHFSALTRTAVEENTAKSPLGALVNETARRIGKNGHRII